MKDQTSVSSRCGTSAARTDRADPSLLLWHLYTPSLKEGAGASASKLVSIRENLRVADKDYGLLT